jgi:hypothetical protein
MALWIDTSNNNATFVGSNADDRIKNGGIVRRRSHHEESKALQKRGSVSCFDRRESTANAQMLLQRHWK